MNMHSIHEFLMVELVAKDPWLGIPRNEGDLIFLDTFDGPLMVHQTAARVLHTLPLGISSKKFYIFIG